MCDKETIPLRYIVINSILETYLIKDTQVDIPVYDFNYIRQHCEGSFVEVYLLVFTKYLLPLIALSINCFIGRKALLIINP